MRVTDYLSNVKSVMNEIRDSYLRRAATLPNRKINLLVNQFGIYPRELRSPGNPYHFKKNQEFELIRGSLERAQLETSIERLGENIKTIDRTIEEWIPEEDILADPGDVDVIMRMIYPQPGDGEPNPAFRGDAKELLKPENFRVARSGRRLANSARGAHAGGAARRTGGRTRKYRQEVSWEKWRFPLAETRNELGGSGKRSQEGEPVPVPAGLGVGDTYLDRDLSRRRIYSRNPLITGPAEPDDKHPSTTSFGMPVRSKNEGLIAETLREAGISFDYEPVIYLYDEKMERRKMIPDFCIQTPAGTLIWEHAGMMDRPDYRINLLQKLRIYFLADKRVPENLIITMSRGATDIDMRQIDKIIKYFVAEALN